MATATAGVLDRALDRTLIGYSRIGYAARCRLWRQPADARLDGKLVGVTGATSGIGLATATGLARLGASVRLLVRNPERGETAQAAIVTQAGNDDVSVLVCDLADLGSVRRCAGHLAAEPLHVLVNNAGVLPRRRELSVDGIELTLATNVIGPFLLTQLLVPALSAGAGGGGGVIINVSSAGMYTQRIHVDDLQMEREEFNGVTAYARAKRAEVILTELWAARLADRGISVHAMHPGWVDTPGLAESLPRFRRLTRPLLRSAEEGADTIVWLAAAQGEAIGTGGFWQDRRRRPTHRLRRTQESDAERALLWAQCAELAQI